MAFKPMITPRGIKTSMQRCSRCKRMFESIIVSIPGRPSHCGNCLKDLEKLHAKEQKLEKKAKKAEAKGNIKKAERLRKKKAKLKKRE